MGKRTKYEAKVERIRNMMMDAGIYEARYEIQIEQTADNMQEIEEIKTDIRKSRTKSQDKNVEGGTKLTVHPLYPVVLKLDELLIRQLAALGLNKLNAKKEEAAEAKTEKKDGIQTMLGGRRGN